MTQYISIDPAASCGVAVYRAHKGEKFGITATIKRGRKDSFSSHIQNILDFAYFNIININHLPAIEQERAQTIILIESGVYIGFRNKNHAAVLDEYRGALTYGFSRFGTLENANIYRIKPDEWKLSLGLKRNAGKDEIKYLYDSVCSTERGQDEIDAMGMIYHDLFGRPHDLDIKEFFNIFDVKKDDKPRTKK
jgi:hypothetical protein